MEVVECNLTTSIKKLVATHILHSSLKPNTQIEIPTTFHPSNQDFFCSSNPPNQSKNGNSLPGCRGYPQPLNHISRTKHTHDEWIFPSILEPNITPKIPHFISSTSFSCPQCILCNLYPLYQICCTNFSFCLFCTLCRCIGMFMDLAHKKVQSWDQTIKVPGNKFGPYGVFDVFTFLKCRNLSGIYPAA